MSDSDNLTREAARTIGIVDDDPELAAWLRRACPATFGASTLLQVISADEVDSLLSQGCEVILVDSHIGSSLNAGLDVVRALRDGGYQGAIIAISDDERARADTAAADPAARSFPCNKRIFWDLEDLLSSLLSAAAPTPV
jgi:ActR/RegA family two-component response regulator